MDTELQPIISMIESMAHDLRSRSAADAARDVAQAQQIGSIIERMNVLVSEVGELKRAVRGNGVDGLTARMGKVEQHIDELQSTIDRLEARIATLTASLERAAEHKASRVFEVFRTILEVATAVGLSYLLLNR